MFLQYSLFLEKIIVVNMFHNVLHPAMQDVTQLINGVDFYILIVAQAV